MAAIQTPALILSVKTVGEADCLVTFLTPVRGRLTGVAKHARKSRRRFPNVLEPLNRVELWLSARPRGELEFLEKGELVRAFAGLRRDLPRLAAAAVLAELAGELASPLEGAGAIFALLELALSRLEEGAAPDSLLLATAAHLLKLGGYAWQLEACRTCGERPAGPAWLSLREGGIYCPACRTQAPGPLMSLDAGARKLLAAAQSLPADRLNRLVFPPRQAEQCLAALRSFLRHHLDRPLKAWEFFDRIRAGAASPAGL
ncbi:MAG: DNA repair protein RecO [Syntrophobacterales bacterium]|nr:DNA repair protein RecO [Syntrophobacterales bacterium]